MWFLDDASVPSSIFHSLKIKSFNPDVRGQVMQGTDSAPSIDIDRRASASAFGILSEGISTALQTPTLYGLYLVVAIIGWLLIQPLPGMVSTVLDTIVSSTAGGIAVIMAYTTLGGRPNSRESFAGRLVFVLISQIIAGIIIGIGFICLIIPGIYLYIRLQLIIPVIMLEGCGPIEALSRSSTLTKGHTWTILGVGIVFIICSLFFMFVIYAMGLAPVEDLTLATLRQALQPSSTLAAIVITPISISSYTVMYGLYSQESSHQ